MSKSIQYTLIIMMVMQIVVCLTSWLIGIYVDDVNGVLTAQGIRWFVSTTMDNFRALPLAEIISGMMTFSVLRESGIFKLTQGHISLKQRRAIQTTLIFICTFVSLFVILLLLPHSVLLSALGTLTDSPFAKGGYGITLSFLILVGNIYGYTSGRFVTFGDFIDAHISIFKVVSSYFILLFASSIFINTIDYTDFLTFLGDEALAVSILKFVFYYLPLTHYLYLLIKIRREN